MFFRKKKPINPKDYDFVGPAIAHCLADSRLRNPPWSPDSLSELTDVESRLSTKLPEAFKEYALVFGTVNHELFGSECNLQTLSEQIEPWETEEVKEFNAFFKTFYGRYPKFKDLPIFEFSSHHGYVSYLFVLNEDDNPECFVSVELGEVEEMGRFSDYLLRQLKNS